MPRHKVPNGRQATAAIKAEAGPYGLQVLDRVFDILDSLAEEPQTASGLGERLGLHRTTAFRLLANLAARGYVTKDEATGQYRLGMRLFHLGSSAMQRSFPLQRLRPELDQLAVETGQTAQLWMRDADEAICIDQVESPADTRVIGRIGRRFPLHAGAVGKTLLAFAPESVIERILEHPLERLSERTLTDRKQLRRELAAIRRAGFGAAPGENPLVARVLAAPVFGAQATVDLVVALLLPDDARDREAQAKDPLKATAARMGEVFGYVDTQVEKSG